MTAHASVEDLCDFLRRKYHVPPARMHGVRRAIAALYARKKNFDIIVNDGRVMVLTKKTPSPSPQVDGPS